MEPVHPVMTRVSENENLVGAKSEKSAKQPEIDKVRQNEGIISGTNLNGDAKTSPIAWANHCDTKTQPMQNGGRKSSAKRKTSDRTFRDNPYLEISRNIDKLSLNVNEREVNSESDRIHEENRTVHLPGQVDVTNDENEPGCSSHVDELSNLMESQKVGKNKMSHLEQQDSSSVSANDENKFGARTKLSSMQHGRSFSSNPIGLSNKPIYPSLPFSPYNSPSTSPRLRRLLAEHAPRESRRVSMETFQNFILLNQYKLTEKIGQVSKDFLFYCCMLVSVS